MHFEKKLGGEIKFEGKIVNVLHDRVELANGRTSLREVITHPGAVAVLALAEGNVLLVRQFRYAVGRELLEIPAGKLEPGEHPERAAIREMREETGAVCGELTYLADYYGSPGILSETIHLYFARVESLCDPNPDEDELIDTERLSPQELSRLIARGEVRDGKTVFAFTVACAKGLIPGLSFADSK